MATSDMNKYPPRNEGSGIRTYNDVNERQNFMKFESRTDVLQVRHTAPAVDHEQESQQSR